MYLFCYDWYFMVFELNNLLLPSTASNNDYDNNDNSGDDGENDDGDSDNIGHHFCCNLTQSEPNKGTFFKLNIKAVQIRWCRNC